MQADFVEGGDADDYLKHIPRKGWMCTICGKISNAKTNMQRHVRGVHTGKKNLKCYLCKSSFTTQNVRQIHYRRKHGLSLSLKEILDMDTLEKV